eukprot:4613575-Pleurochrysis_carterae.AAC.2
MQVGALLATVLPQLCSAADRIRLELNLEASLPLVELLRKAHDTLGLKVDGSLLEQIKRLAGLIGLPEAGP